MAAKTMTVGMLKKWLADKPDDMVFLRPAPDHSYARVHIWVGKVVLDPETGMYYEHPGEGQTLDAFDEGCEEKEAIIVG